MSVELERAAAVLDRGHGGGPGVPRESRTPTRSARCWASPAFLESAGVATTVSYPNEPLEPPRWAALLPGSERARRPPSAFPKAPSVMVTCDCASFDRLAMLGGAADARRRGHLDRPPPVERRDWGHDLADRPRRVVHVRDGVPTHRGHGRRDVRRHRHVPVRGSGDGHGPLPVRGHHAGDPADGGDAARARLRPHAARAGPLRGQPARRTSGSWGPRSNASSTSPEADLVWTYLTQADLREAGVHPGETDDLIDAIRSARDVDVAAVLKQQKDGRFKVSVRSRGDARPRRGRRGVRRRRASARGRLHVEARSRRAPSSGSSGRCAASP